ncbi:MAG TPA: UPF0149 family protein [Pseudomonadales bacterium]
MTHRLDELERLGSEAACGPAQGLSTAELHGATIGIGVAGDRFELQDLVELLGSEALSDGERVARFVDEALAALHAEDMSFTLLLPDQEVPRSERLAALAGWCQSFLTGLVAGLARRGTASLTELPEEVQELVEDFAAIAQLDPEDEAGGEKDFMQLEEYVKVGTLLVMSLLSNAGDDSEE